MTPEPTAIQGQLERILASDAFATSGRHSRLLRYLVERTLAGEGEQLKEYVLGTEVFDRSGSYDPRIDSIVRVEARRLRTRLEEYYGGPGKSDEVVITVPRGSYVPVFESRAVGPSTDQTAAGPVTRQTYSPVVIIVAAISVALVVLAAGAAFNNLRNPAQAATGPAVAVLPFEHYTTNEQDALLVAQVTDAVTAELAKLSTVSVVSRTSAARHGGGRESVAGIAKALNAAFLVEASAVVTGNLVQVTARVVDAGSDRKVWVGEYGVSRDDVPAGAERIARDVSDAVMRRVQTVQD